ncbi:MAG TPA: hypothetical protein VGH06_04360 [Candidatus Udaeobacter sp.]
MIYPKQRQFFNLTSKTLARILIIQKSEVITLTDEQNKKESIKYEQQKQRKQQSAEVRQDEAQ